METSKTQDTPVAFITGAGSGIGRATAVALSALRYRLALLGRKIESLDTLRAQLPTESISLAADVTDFSQVDRAVADAVARFGRIDAVVNSAGVAPMLGVEATTAALWREVIDTNLSGPFFVSRAVWPTFRRQRSGVIVNVSSVSARDPYPYFAAYAAAKAGLNALTLTLAKEGQPLGIAVHGVAPGAVETPMLRKILTPEQVPEADALDPADVAAIIVRCVTGELRYSAGETLYVQRRL